MTEPPRVALVVGAARGIGAATVTALAAGGWRVMAVTGARMTRHDRPSSPSTAAFRCED